MATDPKSATFQELEVFLLVARMRSIRAAARELNLLPSHVSKVISRLESKLGLKLIERSATGVGISRDGIATLAIARSVLNEGKPLFRDSQETINQTADLPVLTIGSFSYVNQILLPNSLRRMPDMLTKHRLRILDLPPSTFSNTASKSIFDFVIHNRQDIWPKSWDITSLGQMSWGLFSRTKHPVGETPVIDEVLQYPFVIPTYWQGDEYHAGDDLFPIPWTKRIKGHEASTAFSALQLASQSNHLSYVPKIIAQSFVSHQAVQEVKVAELEIVQRDLYLMTRIDQVGNKEKRAFAKAVTQTLRALEQGHQ